MNMRNIALVGASGMVGQTFLQVIKEYVDEGKLAFENLYLFASARSAGKTVDFNGKELVIEELTPQSFDREIDIALFSAGGSVSKEYASIAAKKGCIVIDNSSAWRTDPEVPLVIPEVNSEDIKNHNGIIANPNCSTIQAVVALAPLHKAYNIQRIIYTTFQSVSGAGQKGILDLERTAKGESPQHFPYPIAGNCIPHIDAFGNDGYTFEELKMINETKKILHAPKIKITATTVRVPVTVGHSESINVTFEKPYDLVDLRRILEESPGIVVQDDAENKIYPTPRETAGTDSVYVGRIRRDFSAENSLNLWVVADNVRKGAATNAIQIAVEILKLTG
ncbi:MAG: aspartate-semialdehyde dehydrogenase [Defluviitaleaceae bacterium]|nr:aspartate-semialdehyde dehydrogenase [Defluviitaleaceae bacterium]